MYLTLSKEDYQSKCSHFFDSAESEQNETVINAPSDPHSIHIANANQDQKNDNDNENENENELDNNERAIIIFKPNITDSQKKDIRRMLIDEMLHVFDETQTYIPRKTLRDLLSHEQYDDYYMDQLCAYMAGNALEAWLVKGENVYKELSLVVGPDDPDVAKIQAPNSIRAKYGVDKIRNVLYFTKNKDIFMQTQRYFFFDEPLTINSDTTTNKQSKNKKDNLQLSLHSVSQPISNPQSPQSLKQQPQQQQQQERAVLLLQHYLQQDQIDSIRVILENKEIHIEQEKSSFLPIDSYKTIFQTSEPN